MSTTGAATAPDNVTNTALIIDACRKLDRLDERTKNTQADVQELKEAFERHRSATEAKSDSVNGSLSFLKGEWKMLLLAIGLVIEHFWNASRLGH